MSLELVPRDLRSEVLGLLGTGRTIVGRCPFCPKDVHYIDLGGLTVLAACQRTAKGELKDPCEGRRILTHIGLSVREVTPRPAVEVTPVSPLTKADEDVAPMSSLSWEDVKRQAAEEVARMRARTSAHDDVRRLLRCAGR